MNNPSIYDQAPPYCHYYFDLIESDNLLIELEKNKQMVLDLIQTISSEKSEYAYAENKWSIKEVLRHLIETERILTYRALRFSRMDSTELPGFEEDAYIENARGMHYDLADLEKEFLFVREATISLYKPMTELQLNFRGIANKVNYTARSIGFMVVGHAIHHCRVIEERY